jgi:RnfABCDGE-type electron transport complex B subunit
MHFVAAVGAMTGLTLILAVLLLVASRKLATDEDPRIDQVESMLPHVNCGACGYPGCRAFAEALVAGEAPPVKCTVSTPADHERIAAFLGVEVGAEEKRVARLACAGGTNVARNRAHYSGHQSCQTAAQVAGGGKSCAWGCLGLGDCEAACEFDAIHLNRHSLPVVNEANCTACNRCVEVCPKDLFSLHPVSHRLWVACCNPLAGDELVESCQAVCTACGRCAMDAPGKLITMDGNLPVVHYDGPHDTQVPIQRCPTGAIVWINPDSSITRGRASPAGVRSKPLLNATS